MGVRYSTCNYEKIIDLVDPRYVDSCNFLNNGLVDAINIDNDNRFMCYRHKTKNIYLFYVGNLCALINYCEVSEQLLLMASSQFNDFYELKEYVIKHYPKNDIISELVKYETSHDVSILNYLEMGRNSGLKTIDISFTDSEDSDESSESYQFVVDNKHPESDVHLKSKDNSDVGFETAALQEDVEVAQLSPTDPVVENDVQSFLAPFDALFDNQFTYDINTDWSLDWNMDSSDINKMPVIDEVHSLPEINTPVHSKESVEKNDPLFMLAKACAQVAIDDGSQNENDDESEATKSDSERESDQESDSSSDIRASGDISNPTDAPEIIEEAPTQYTSIFKNIIPDFNYFNFFK